MINVYVLVNCGKKRAFISAAECITILYINFGAKILCDTEWMRVIGQFFFLKGGHVCYCACAMLRPFTFTNVLDSISMLL